MTKKRIHTEITRVVFIVVIALAVKLTKSEACGEDCVTCSKGVCSECRIGYGLKENKCEECKRSNCLNCDGNAENCVKCTQYHFPLAVEGGKYHRCSKCGFGCEECADTKKCKKCGPMFVQSFINRSQCIVDHSKLFVILVGIAFGMCGLSCLAFLCTEGPKDREEDLLAHRRGGMELQATPGGHGAEVLVTQPPDVGDKKKESGDEDKHMDKKAAEDGDDQKQSEANDGESEGDEDGEEEEDSDEDESGEDEDGEEESSSYESDSEDKKKGKKKKK